MGQCRCYDPNKIVRYETCPACKAKPVAKPLAAPPFKIYATEYVRELVRDPFGHWMAGYRVVEEVWVSLTGKSHQWHDGYGERTDPIATDRNGTRYLCYRNYIDMWGGERWRRINPNGLITSFQVFRGLSTTTVGVDGLPLKPGPS
jgi:hypothetical protein